MTMLLLHTTEHPDYSASDSGPWVFTWRQKWWWWWCSSVDCLLIGRVHLSSVCSALVVCRHGTKCFQSKLSFSKSGKSSWCEMFDVVVVVAGLGGRAAAGRWSGCLIYEDVTRKPLSKHISPASAALERSTQGNRESVVWFLQKDNCLNVYK